MYFMSSLEDFQMFKLNPRTYLLPPMPDIPCKISILGPPTSGKSTLAKKLAEYYNAMVSRCLKMYKNKFFKRTLLYMIWFWKPVTFYFAASIDLGTIVIKNLLMCGRSNFLLDQL